MDLRGRVLAYIGSSNSVTGPSPFCNICRSEVRYRSKPRPRTARVTELRVSSQPRRTVCGTPQEQFSSCQQHRNSATGGNSPWLFSTRPLWKLLSSTLSQYGSRVSKYSFNASIAMIWNALLGGHLIERIDDPPKFSIVKKACSILDVFFLKSCQTQSTWRSITSLAASGYSSGIG